MGALIAFGGGYEFCIPPKEKAIWLQAIEEVLEQPHKPLEQLETMPERSVNVDYFFEELRVAKHEAD